VRERLFGERDGGRWAAPLSLADNVVMVISGDTPNSAFSGPDGWTNGTPGNGNLVYLRSNAFVTPGWFGQMTQSTKTSFDPTGALSPEASSAGATAASLLGILYAITRGDAEYVNGVSALPYEGVKR
jgi:hypothetical protein